MTKFTKLIAAVAMLWLIAVQADGQNGKSGQKIGIGH